MFFPFTREGVVYYLLKPSAYEAGRYRDCACGVRRIFSRRFCRNFDENFRFLQWRPRYRTIFVWNEICLPQVEVKNEEDFHFYLNF